MRDREYLIATLQYLIKNHEYLRTIDHCPKCESAWIGYCRSRKSNNSQVKYKFCIKCGWSEEEI